VKLPVKPGILEIQFADISGVNSPPKREPVNLVVPSLIRINRSCRNVFKKVSITARFYSSFYEKRGIPGDVPS
jgi:hypothetical protein